MGRKYILFLLDFFIFLESVLWEEAIENLGQCSD